MPRALRAPLRPQPSSRLGRLRTIRGEARNALLVLEGSGFRVQAHRILVVVRVRLVVERGWDASTLPVHGRRRCWAAPTLRAHGQPLRSKLAIALYKLAAECALTARRAMILGPIKPLGRGDCGKSPLELDRGLLADQELLEAGGGCTVFLGGVARHGCRGLSCWRYSSLPKAVASVRTSRPVRNTVIACESVRCGRQKRSSTLLFPAS